MTVRTGICVLVMAASMAFAQDSPMGTVDQMRRTVKGIGNANEQRRENAAKQLGLTPGSAPASSTAAKGSAAQSQVQTKGQAKNASDAKSSAAKTVKKTSVVAKKTAAPTQNEATAEPKSQKPEKPGARSHRDPFQTVVRTETAELGCASGKKCLVVSKILLKGIVRSQAGMIAVVENEQKKSYFLHENDPVFNGHVVRISSDSVVFQEKVVDKVGRSSIRDVVKRLSSVPAA